MQGNKGQAITAKELKERRNGVTVLPKPMERGNEEKNKETVKVTGPPRREALCSTTDEFVALISFPARLPAVPVMLGLPVVYKPPLGFLWWGSHLLHTQHRLLAQNILIYPLKKAKRSLHLVMELKVNYQSGGCRSGELQINRIPIETPTCLLYTRSGAIPHVAIWNDLLEYNYYSPIQLTLPTLVDQPTLELVKGLDKGIHSFIGQKTLSVLTVQDPASDPPIGYNEDKAVSVWNAGGRRKIDVAQFTSTVLSFRPNVVECLCDTIPSKGQTPKRIKKSVDRTLKYLDEIMKFKQENKELETCSVVGAIEGSDSIAERIRSAKETASRQVAGFMLEGFDGSADDWTNILTRTVTELPENKPRFIQGIKTPDDIIKAVECGIDVFDSSFPYQVTERGCALIFPSPNKKLKPESSHIESTSIESTTSQETQSQENKENNDKENEDANNDLPNSTKYEINLHDTIRFKSDMSSIDRCGCYCCISHSRAYVHHLLVTKEMLAQVLLMMHNMHQYYKFFEQMRLALSDGKWEEFKSRF